MSPAGLGEARDLAAAVRQEIDNGKLTQAELRLAEGKQAVEGLAGRRADEVSLTLALEESTLAQYRGRFDEAWWLADETVAFADERFGPRGIPVARAKLRRNFALEARKKFSDALRADLELADELVGIPGSETLRLNCLTRATACAVKNADRAKLQIIGVQADPLWQRLEKSGNGGATRWFHFWSAVALLRQNRIGAAVRLMEHADTLGPSHWRWDNATLCVLAYAMTLKSDTRQRGTEMLEAARLDARRRGFRGLVRSIDAGFGV